MNPNDIFADDTIIYAVLARLNAKRARLEDYDYLQRSLRITNVTQCALYRGRFKEFYVVRRDDDWCEIYFEVLEREKHNETPSFQEVLEEMHNRAEHNTKYGRKHLIERSFSSKLVATINPELPVWDKHVRDNLGLNKPAYPSLGRTVEIYSEIRLRTLRILQSERFENWRARFDEAFPQFTHFTDVKKLDLFLWQKR